MPRIAALFALIFAIASNARAGNVIHVADGDCAALNAAVSLAPAGEQTTVVLARNGTYNTTNTQAVDYCGLWVHAGNVVVEGQGSVLSSQVCGSGLTIVDAGAQLTLRDANALGQDCGLGNTIITDVSNDGDLSFENVSLRIVSAKNYQNASMTLRNVTVSSPVGIVNSGSLNVFNSTLFTNIGTNPDSARSMQRPGRCSRSAATSSVRVAPGRSSPMCARRTPRLASVRCRTTAVSASSRQCRHRRASCAVSVLRSIAKRQTRAVSCAKRAPATPVPRSSTQRNQSARVA